MRFAEPMVAPVRKFVVGLSAVALAHVSPEHALATEPASAADQAALPESIAPARPQPAATGDQDLPGRWNVAWPAHIRQTVSPKLYFTLRRAEQFEVGPQR